MHSEVTAFDNRLRFPDFRRAAEERAHRSAARETRARAGWALDDVDMAMRAAAARERCGSWEPGAAIDFHDFCALAWAAEEV
ncbi:hypothetical protein [Mycobacterium syngnathidarum]